MSSDDSLIFLTQTTCHQGCQERERHFQNKMAVAFQNGTEMEQQQNAERADRSWQPCF